MRKSLKGFQETIEREIALLKESIKDAMKYGDENSVVKLTKILNDYETTLTKIKQYKRGLI